jgi:hypothetical protein
MDHPLRYVFHSHAARRRIVRPKDVILEAQGASALLVTGGRPCHIAADHVRRVLRG